MLEVKCAPPYQGCASHEFCPKHRVILELRWELQEATQAWYVSTQAVPLNSFGSLQEPQMYRPNPRPLMQNLQSRAWPGICFLSSQMILQHRTETQWTGASVPIFSEDEDSECQTGSGTPTPSSKSRLKAPKK